MFIIERSKGVYWKAQSSKSILNPNADSARREEGDKQVRKTLQSPASECGRLEKEKTPGVPGSEPPETDGENPACRRQENPNSDGEYCTQESSQRVPAHLLEMWGGMAEKVKL